MRIIYAGTPEVAVPTLETLHAQHDVAAVLTREDAPVGRKRTLTASPVAQAAEKLGLRTIKANRITPEISNELITLEADLGVVVAYGNLLRDPLLTAPTHGWINLHFSHLPAWRGAAPVQRALMNGETELGMNVFQLVEELDAGDVLAAATHTVEFGTTAGAALTEMAVAGAGLIAETLEDFDRITPKPQSGAASYAHKLTRGDGALDPSWDARTLIARWAGATPAPGGFFHELKVHDMKIAASVPELAAEPGSCELVGNRVFLATGSTPVELLRVQPVGKAAMDAAAWLRGRGGRVRVEAGRV